MKASPGIILSGGGTGGHIFPAISIAQAIKELQPDTRIMFVGAEGRMEMEKVPQAGFPIVGLPIAGFQRKNIFKNLRLPLMLLKSLQRASEILREFRPDVAVGTGGYASGPLLWMAGRKNIPYILQEQNGFPGLTNRLLTRSARWICTGYPDMEKYFPKEKIRFTGNPVRKDLLDIANKKNEALEYFGLKPHLPVILVLGGSLGARAINEAIRKNLITIIQMPAQVIWQTGKNYIQTAQGEFRGTQGIYIADFIRQMDLAYAASDIVVSRAGASTVSEICLTGKPSILIPSPNVAEDHQTRNALVLSERHAAMHLPEPEAEQKLSEMLRLLLKSEEKRKKLSEEALKISKPHAAQEIAELALSLIS